MELAPNVSLVTNAFCALRMATWWHVPLDHVRAIRAGRDNRRRGPDAWGAVAAETAVALGSTGQATGASLSRGGLRAGELELDVVGIPKHEHRAIDLVGDG